MYTIEPANMIELSDLERKSIKLILPYPGDCMEITFHDGSNMLVRTIVYSDLIMYVDLIS